MEGYDRLMLRDMFEALRPNAQLSMKEEYREKFADGLKAEIPELFPTVKIVEGRLDGFVFKGPKTKLVFSGNQDVDILIFDFKDYGFGGEWDYMSSKRHVEIEAKVMNILRKIYREKGQGVRNAQLTGALTGLPHGPESRIASMLSGIEGKNAYQQGDELKRRAGIQGPFPNRKQYSGRRKTVRRKNLRSSRKNK
jgi:hypothetical protein